MRGRGNDGRGGERQTDRQRQTETETDRGRDRQRQKIPLRYCPACDDDQHTKCCVQSIVGVNDQRSACVVVGRSTACCDVHRTVLPHLLLSVHALNYLPDIPHLYA